jgi:hypothetical protein
MKEKKVLEKRYGHWTILDEKPVKISGKWMVACQCDCGRKKLSLRSAFLVGMNSEKCMRCSINIQRKLCFSSSK